MSRPETVSSSPSTSWVLGPVVLILAGMGLSLWSGWPTTVPPMVGRKMPALELQMIQGGEAVGLSQGAVATLPRSPSKILFVNFWASWCATCRDEEADLEAFWQAHKDEGVMMLGLAFNDESEAAKAIVTANKTTYPVALDVDNKSALAYGITGVPETFAIGSDGVIVHHQIGPVDRPLLEAILQKMR